MIKAEELTRKYGDFTAVNQVSFNIARGEIIGLLGHNGAGKTTILKMLTGFLEPTAGKVLIDSMDIAEQRLKIQNKIGYLPENCPLYPEMTVIDYLDYMAGLRSVPRNSRAEAIRTAIRNTELADKAMHSINTLSRGYRQRVGVAQAILNNPEILILDEPTNGLDPSQIQHMRDLITEFGDKSTIIISTHILQEVQAICDRVIIILNGRIALDSRLEDIRKSHRLLFEIDREPAEAQGAISKINSVQAVTFLGSENNRYLYAAEIRNGPEEDGIDSVASEVAQAVIKQGYKLYAMYPEKRDLEAIFREINTNYKGAENDR